MKKIISITLLLFMSLITIGITDAMTYVERFEHGASWPALSGWLGTNSNIWRAAGRDNSDGVLWIHECTIPGVETSVYFEPTFGQKLTGWSMDIVSYLPTRYEVYDMLDNLIYSGSVLQDDPTQYFTSVIGSGGSSSPGVNHSVTSLNGISRFILAPVSADVTKDEFYGQTIIDNVVAETRDDYYAAESVPEPNTLLIMGSALVIAAFYRKKTR